jgi:ABC-type glycerol-3-phosphate transport system substrate-binding protein
MMPMGGTTMRARRLLAVAIILAPFDATAADLVVWWDKAYYAEEGAALREIIAAFEHETGKEAELVFHPMEELPDKIAAALEVGQPPDFAFGFCEGFRMPAGRGGAAGAEGRRPKASKEGTRGGRM